MAAGTNATTRTRTRGAGPRLGEPILANGDALASAESGLSYRIDRFIGQGGYGQVYTARRLGRSRTVPQSLCVKISRRIDSWIREAYSGSFSMGIRERSPPSTRSSCRSTTDPRCTAWRSSTRRTAI